MGQNKHEMEYRRWLSEIGQVIAHRAGALEQCEVHEEFFGGDEHDRHSTEKVYKLATKLISDKDALVAGVRKRKDLTDAIQNVIRDHGGESCGYCAKNAASD